MIKSPQPLNELLTAKQVQDLLKVDRTTVYRMINDGRLKGIKIGNQWRFPEKDVRILLSGSVKEGRPLTDSIKKELPLHCMHAIQDVFADIAGIGSVTTAADGEPLTEISNSCQFCQLILNSEKGRQGCIKSWRRLAEQKESEPKFVTCHAGLQYAQARIEINGQLAAMLIAGQFYSQKPDAAEEQARLEKLSRQYGIDKEALCQAAQKLVVLDRQKQDKIGHWLERVAHTFEELTMERGELIKRLRDISAISGIVSES